MNRSGGLLRPGHGPWRLVIFSVALVAAFAVWWSLTNTAMAQTAADGGAPVAAPTAPGPGGVTPMPIDGVEMGGGVPTIAKLFMTSPVINSALLAMSVLALVMFMYLLLSMTQGSFNPPRFIDDVTKLIINRQFDQAIHLCQTHTQVFTSSIIQRIIENRAKDPDVLMEILSAEGRRRGELIWNRVGYLSIISEIAPMLGLLGTVMGMIKVFFTLTTRTVGEKVGQLSAGIAEAMGTTMFGLIVAIAAGVFYAIIKTQATAVLAEAEHVCHTISDHTHRAVEEGGPASRSEPRPGKKKIKVKKKKAVAPPPDEDDDEADDDGDADEPQVFAGADDDAD